MLLVDYLTEITSNTAVTTMKTPILIGCPVMVACLYLIAGRVSGALAI